MKGDVIQIKKVLNGEYEYIAYWVFETYFNGLYAGYCNCNIEGGTNLLIADLLVKEKEVQPQLKWWQRILTRRKEPIYFRKRGIGTAIVSQVFDLAQDQQVSRVYGYVTQSDLDETPTLLGWYEELGFTICEPDGNEIVPAVKMIEMLT